MHEINTPHYSIAIYPVILVTRLAWCCLYYATSLITQGNMTTCTKSPFGFFSNQALIVVTRQSTC